MSYLDHIQVWAPDALGFDSDGAYVDWGMLGILRDVWLEGVSTLYSCEGGHVKDEEGNEYCAEAYLMFSKSEGNREIVERILKKHDMIVTAVVDPFRSDYWLDNTVITVNFTKAENDA